MGDFYAMKCTTSVGGGNNLKESTICINAKRFDNGNICFALAEVKSRVPMSCPRSVAKELRLRLG